MNKDMFYLAVIILVSIVVMFLFPKAYTGQVACDGVCTQLCDATEECNLGEVCCPTELGGVCEISQNCALVADFLADGGTLEEYSALQERPKIISNIGWQTFWQPLVVICIIIIAIVLSTKRKPLKN